MKKYILLVTIICCCITSFGQRSISFQPIKYLLNKDVDQQIKRYVNYDIGGLKMSMGIKVTWDGKAIFNQELDCFTKAFLKDDTISITGYMSGLVGWGFQLSIFKDSCIVNAYARSDGEVYRYNTSDKSLLTFIAVPSLTQRVVLSKNPSFEKGERVAGFVDIVSNDFYYSIDKKDTKARIKLSAYFKTEPLITISR